MLNTLDFVPSQGHASSFGGLFGYLIQQIILFKCGVSIQTQYPQDIGDQLQDSYDFIVVGAGSAGSVIANRLSEIENWKILLVEAGDDPLTLSEIPLLGPRLKETEMDWGYWVESDIICKGTTNTRFYWPQGKGLGGTSSLNGNIYIRGNQGDYDSWKRKGNEGWGYNDVLEYFKKSEDMRDDNVDEKYHGKGGYLTVDKYSFNSSIKEAIINAGVELGYKALNDMNGEEVFGFGEAHGTLRDGKRCSTAKAFLSSAKDRANLNVAKSSYVTRILLDKTGELATGIELIKNGKTIQVKATKEVIVSAGALNSPQLLMVSGIGPKSHLQDMGIDVVKDLSVGHNLKDHIFFPVIFQVNKTVSDSFSTMSILYELDKYCKKGTGLFGSITITDLAGFIKTTSDLRYPDIQLYHMHFPMDNMHVIEKFIQFVDFNPEVAEYLTLLNSKSDLLWILPTLLHPKSSGSIQLRSNNPMVRPLIKAGYLSEPEDVETILRGIHFAKKLGETQVLKDYGVTLTQVKMGWCDDHTFDTDDYWKCAMRHMALTVYHPTSTCKMGPNTDTEAVVDAELLVHGFKNLRVADASIMPDIVSGNTNAPTIMIGEKASDMIKKTWTTESKVTGSKVTESKVTGSKVSESKVTGFKVTESKVKEEL